MEVLWVGLCSSAPVQLGQGGASLEMGTWMWTLGVLCGSQGGGTSSQALTLSFSLWPSSPASLTMPFSALTWQRWHQQTMQVS